MECINICHMNNMYNHINDDIVAKFTSHVFGGGWNKEHQYTVTIGMSL